MKRIKCELSLDSLLAASQHIEKYADTWEHRNENLAKRVMEEVSHELYLNLQGIVYNPEARLVVRSENGKQLVPTTVIPDINSPWEEKIEEAGKVTWIVSIEGKDVAFIEFGAGVFHNGGSSSHPRSRALGFKIGEYREHKGKQSAWGYYDEQGNVIVTRGTPAQMPLYKAMTTVMPKIPAIVKEMLESDVYDGWKQ